MGEGFVGLGHAECVFFLFYRGAFVVGGGYKFGGELLRHRLAFAAAGGEQYPTERERLLALGAHLARHLIVGAADAAGADFHRRPDVADCRFKKLYRIFRLRLFFYDIEGVVHHLACRRLFTVPHNRVDEFFHAHRTELDVGAGNVAVFYWSTHIKLLFTLRSLGTVARAADTALVEAGGIEFAAHYRVADVDILYAAGAQDNHRVLLEVVALAGDIGSNLHTVGQAHAGDFTYCGVRLAGSFGGYLGAHSAFKRRRVEDRLIFKRIEAAPESGRFRFCFKLCASFADKLGKSHEAK